MIGRIAKEVKAPISILAGPQSPSVTQLQDLGVARVSYGSGFLKAAITGAKRLAQEIIEKGTCGLLKDGMQTPEINALVATQQINDDMNTPRIGRFTAHRANRRRPMITIAINRSNRGAGNRR